MLWQDLLDRKWKGTLEKSFLRFTQFIVWAYVAVVLVVWLLLHLAGDRWWFASLLLFGPRWFGLLPLLVIVPLATVMRPRLLLPVGLVTFLFVFWVMGFWVAWPWQSWLAGQGQAVNLLTCNVQGGEGGWDRFRQLLYCERPDIVALQEVSGELESPFPEDWHVVREGQLLIASPHPIRDMRTWYRREPPAEWPPLLALYAIVDCPGRSTAVCNIHLTSPHHGITETLDRHTGVSIDRSKNLTRLNELRQQESESLSAWIGELPQVDILLGDFNLPVESRIYNQSWSDYRNAFSHAGFGVGYTRWVRIHNFEYGARIDHILTSDNWKTAQSYIGRHIGSDHMPLVAEVRWAGEGE